MWPGMPRMGGHMMGFSSSLWVNLASPTYFWLEIKCGPWPPKMIPANVFHKLLQRQHSWVETFLIKKKNTFPKLFCLSGIFLMEGASAVLGKIRSFCFPRQLWKISRLRFICPKGAEGTDSAPPAQRLAPMNLKGHWSWGRLPETLSMPTPPRDPCIILLLNN